MQNKNSKNKIPYELSDYVLRNYFVSTGLHQGWFPSGGKAAALAVSGGGDSISLLWFFRTFYDGGPLTAIHINHGIRGTESDEDENFTAVSAENSGVPFRAVKVNVPSSRLKGESLETSARRLRLQALIDTAHELGIKSVMLGHNRDDLAETVMFNILRGTGIRGSVGITESTQTQGITFYRPLLGLRREFLRDILRARGLSWREDSSNNDDSYTRNFIRLKLLPLIEESINSSAVEHLARFGEDMRSVREYEDELSAELLSSCLEDPSTLTLNRKTLRNFSHSSIMLVIREMGRRLGLRTLSRKRCSELAGLILKDDNFVFQWCGNFTVSGKNKMIYFKGDD